MVQNDGPAWSISPGLPWLKGADGLDAGTKRELAARYSEGTITSLAASIRPGPETIGLVQCTPNQVLDHRRHHACIAIPSADVLSRRAEKSF